MKKHLLIASFFFCMAVMTNAQKTTNLSEFQFNKLNENVVLITDKELYLAGEQILFSSFYTQDGQIANNDLSKVLYAELFNAQKDIIWQGKFSIENAHSFGIIDIPTEIFSGTYFLRAYTQLQKNQAPETYFTKAIRIINPAVNLPAPNKQFSDEIVISPKGGKLIANVENFIALRMQYGLTGLLSSIWISDQYGNHIANPEIYKNGLGYVYLTPVDSLQYLLKIAFSDGDTVAKPLTVYPGSGLLLSIIHEGRYLNFNILSSKTAISKNTYQLKIISENGQEIVNTTFSDNKISIQDSLFESKIYLCELNDSNNQLLAKQYFLGRIDKPKEVLVKTNKESYKQREEVSLTIENEAENETAILSVSVTERGTNSINSEQLPSYLIDNPILIPFYIETTSQLDSAGVKQLDIILQLNSFPFKNLFTEKVVSFIWPPETSDVNIAALLRNKKTKEAVSGRKVYVSVLGDDPQLHVNLTKEDGMVYFSLTHSTNTKDIFLCAESYDYEEIELLVLNDFSSEFPDFVEVPLEIDTSYRNQLEENWKTIQVENQYQVLEKYKSEEDLHLPSRFGRPDYHVETKDFIELTNAEELFKEIVPYTRLKKKSGKYYFEVMDPVKNVVYDNPLILIDDVPLFNYNNLSNLPFSIIESVDVYAKQYVYGDFIFNGIVLIKTYTDNFAGLLMSYGSVFAVYQTITPEVIIQFPEYNADTSKQSRLPEFRTLLFWEPDFVLKDKKKNFTFYTSDYSAEYDVIVRGITTDGKPYFGTTSFGVISEKLK